MVENEDGSIQLRTEFSAKEVQTLLQFAVNMAGSIGVGAAKIAREDQDMQQELND